MITQENPSSVEGPQLVEKILDQTTGFMQTQAIHVAAELGIADLLKDGSKSIDELAAMTGRTALRFIVCYVLWLAWTSSPKLTRGFSGKRHWEQPCKVITLCRSNPWLVWSVIRPGGVPGVASATPL